MKEALGNEPLLSVVLATDTYERVVSVIESLAAQTIAKKTEMVLVMTTPADASARMQLGKTFHSLKVIDIESIVPLARARAKGVRAAESPFVFIAETHAYPDPGLAEKLIAALSEEWSLAVPGFRNANPDSRLSWAGFLSDYGAWAETLPPGEIEIAPSHDAAFRRSVLLEFGDRLENALTFGDELYLTLRARGHRSYFEPSAGIKHVNINKFRSFVRERYFSGVLTGGYRSARWSLARRLAYACGSPLIPIVILSRSWKGVREIGRRQSLPAGTISALVFGTTLKAAGELRGYLLGASKSAEEGITGYEVRKLAFNGGES
jgi:Glycosyl transferase family 2